MLHNEFKEELHYDEHQIISLTVTNTGDVSQPKFIVDDPTIATVDERGFLRSVSIGSTQIRAYSDDCNTEQVFNFTVIPYYNIYHSPIREYGASIAAIKSKETRQLLRESEDTLVYNDPIYNFEIKYYFSENKLVKCYTGLKQSDPSIPPTGNEILIYLKERYEQHNGYPKNFFWDRKKKDYIFTTASDEYTTFIVYQPERPI